MVTEKTSSLSNEWTKMMPFRSLPESHTSQNCHMWTCLAVFLDVFLRFVFYLTHSSLLVRKSPSSEWYLFENRNQQSKQATLTVGWKWVEVNRGRPEWFEKGNLRRRSVGVSEKFQHIPWNLWAEEYFRLFDVPVEKTWEDLTSLIFRLTSRICTAGAESKSESQTAKILEPWFNTQRTPRVSVRLTDSDI